MSQDLTDYVSLPRNEIRSRSNLVHSQSEHVNLNRRLSFVLPSPIGVANALYQNSFTTIWDLQIHRPTVSPFRATRVGRSCAGIRGHAVAHVKKGNAILALTGLAPSHSNSFSPSTQYSSLKYSVTTLRNMSYPHPAMKIEPGQSLSTLLAMPLIAPFCRLLSSSPALPSTRLVPAYSETSVAQTFSPNIETASLHSRRQIPPRKDGGYTQLWITTPRYAHHIHDSTEPSLTGVKLKTVTIQWKEADGVTTMHPLKNYCVPYADVDQCAYNIIPVCKFTLLTVL